MDSAQCILQVAACQQNRGLGSSKAKRPAHLPHQADHLSSPPSRSAPTA